MKIASLFCGSPCGWVTRSRVKLQNSSLPFGLNEIVTSGRLVFGSVDRLALVIMLPSMPVYSGLYWGAYFWASFGLSCWRSAASTVPGTHFQTVR